MIAFTDRFARVTVGLRLLAGTDLRIVSRFARQKISALVAQSGRLSKTEPSQLVDQFVAAETLSERAEIVVARISDRLRRTERRELVVMHASDGKAEPGESSGAHRPRICLDQPGTQSRQSGERLHRRTGHDRFRKSDFGIYHRAQASALRIHHNDRAFALAERFGRSLLQCGVDFILGSRRIQSAWRGSGE